MRKINDSSNLANSDVKMYSSFWRTRSLHSTAKTSPSKVYKQTFNVRSYTEDSLKDTCSDFAKKSVCDIRYYLQVHQKKMRGALISKNF